MRKNTWISQISDDLIDTSSKHLQDNDFMENKQSIPFWGWVVIGFLALVIFKLAAIVLGFFVIICQAFTRMSPKEKQEMMHRAHIAHTMHKMGHNSKTKDKHK